MYVEAGVDHGLLIGADSAGSGVVGVASDVGPDVAAQILLASYVRAGQRFRSAPPADAQAQASGAPQGELDPGGPPPDVAASGARPPDISTRVTSVP